MSSNCCGGNCGCGPSCQCGSSCGGGGGGCKMNPDMGFSENTATETLIVGLASNKAWSEGGAMGAGAGENGGCKCGPNCTCNPCTCK